jgi:phage gp16-like protein
MAISQANLAKIHIAKKEMTLSDYAYRDILSLHFQVSSASKLNDKQAVVLLNIFRAKGWQPKKGHATTGGKRKGGDFITIKPGPAAKQQRKILAMWHQLGYGMDNLHARCQRQFAVDRFEWLQDGESLHILITDLGKRLETAGKTVKEKRS